MKNNLPQGAEHELNFWKNFITTAQFATWLHDSPTPELEPEVIDFFRNHSTARVLDVASGVVSVLNGLVPKLMLYTTDLLGEEYRQIFDYKKHKILPPAAIAAEDLPKDSAISYDIVHIRNGLDHCQDVRKAYEAMKLQLKPGGYLVIQGFENEADAERWKGFHQCNLSLNAANAISVTVKRSNGFEVTSMGNEEDMHIHYAVTTTLPNGKKWFVWIGQKH